MSTRVEARFVAAWLDARAGHDAPASRVAELMLTAMEAIWSRAKTSLGEVTLAAIYGRVFETGRRDHPLVDRMRLEIEPHGTFDLDREVVREADPAEMRATVEALLTELLHVLGRLTGQTILPGVHETLARTAIETAEPPSRPKKDRDRR